MDADQLGALYRLAEGVTLDVQAQAMDALAEVGASGHFLGCAHTRAPFKEAFWRSDPLDYKPFETWDEEGARDTVSLAADRAKAMLGRHQPPAMDEGVRETLDSYVARRKKEMPDAFM